jgi:nitrile hydratase
VLEEFGISLPTETRIAVWDSTAEVRYLVIPQRPENSEKMSESELRELVNRNSMIGTALATPVTQAKT